jgi:O-antigen/teichoic acid export membrane protein
MSSFSYFPAALLHAAGRPDLTAKLHLIEAPFYILAVWILIERYGIEGAAIAWVARSVLDNIVLFSMAGRILKITYPKTQILLNASIVLALLFGSMLLPENLNFKLGYTAIVIGCLLVFSWTKTLTFEERSFLRSYFNKFKVS